MPSGPWHAGGKQAPVTCGDSQSYEMVRLQGHGPGGKNYKMLPSIWNMGKAQDATWAHKGWTQQPL